MLVAGLIAASTTLAVVRCGKTEVIKPTSVTIEGTFPDITYKKSDQKLVTAKNPLTAKVNPVGINQGVTWIIADGNGKNLDVALGIFYNNETNEVWIKADAIFSINKPNALTMHIYNIYAVSNVDNNTKSNLLNMKVSVS